MKNNNQMVKPLSQAISTKGIFNNMFTGKLNEIFHTYLIMLIMAVSPENTGVLLSYNYLLFCFVVIK